MVMKEAGRPLEPVDRPVPEPGPGEIALEVVACGVCRTDLHILDGELTDPSLPLVPGHQIVGRVRALGPGVDGLAAGQAVGVPWLGWTCGECFYCINGAENLCQRARFTGYHRDGGFAEVAVADARFAFPLPDDADPVETAPLLCAGLIGHRAYRMALDTARPVRRLGLYGFGSAAHILAQVAVHDGLEVHAFTRPGDAGGQAFARSMGATWAGGSDQAPPEPLDAAVIFAPVGGLIPAALGAVRPGGAVVCAGIHMSEIPAFPYALLWEERVVRSVANLTRSDAATFLELAPRVPVRARARSYPLESAGEALEDLRSGRLEGAAVLEVGSGARDG
jgi:propanol-preferring alcohol dehydrogenase